MAPGADAVVIGVGGLGHMAVQILAATNGRGAEVVFDFVGAGATLGLAAGVIALARRGAIKVTTEHHPLTDAAEVLESLEAGKVAGRAVLVP